jgi:putative redox protein
MSIHVETEAKGGTRQTITVDAHTLHADTVGSNGGGTAPNPHDLLDAALGSCKAITATLYARLKGMKLERVIVEVRRDDSKEREGTYKLDVEIAFEGDLTDAERQRLHEIAGRCPIHKLLTSSTVELAQTLRPAAS